MGKAFQCPDVPLHFRPALGWALRGGLAACLCMLTASADARPLVGTATTVAPSFYQRALDRFHHQDFAEALRLLDRLPNDLETDSKAQADILNLRGAIYLRQAKFEKARPLFTQAMALDPGLWAARFNLAETFLRQKRYADSQQQFDALLGRTSRSQQPEEWRLVQYKMLLSMLLNGQDGSEFNKELDRLGKERKPALGYYYLRAAVESRQNHVSETQKWLAQASAAYPLDTERVYAESFQQMGWSGERSTRLIAASENTRPKPMPVLGPGASPVAAAFVKEPPLPPGVSATGNSQNSPTTLAMLQLMPAPRRAAASAPAPAAPTADRMTARFSVDHAAGTPNFRYGGVTVAPPAREEIPTEAAGSTPPQFATSDDLPVRDEAAEINTALPVPPEVNQGMLVMARKPIAKKPAANSNSETASTPPAPSPGATASPAVSVPSSTPPAAAQADQPTPSATPTPVPPLPAFLEKLEIALIKYTNKDYPGAAAALDEADKIQRNQPSSIELRAKIFSYYYKTAYNKYLEKDYTGAQSILNEADAVQVNQPDALNLHGLIMSRQRDYDEAERMFKKAVDADPGFWAAKFNMAELPFTRRNYTEARRRYEKLLSETDPVKQQREAELTQFKVFLTLLLEGKETAARDFMDHFKFTGATPARYYCQAALEFYSGSAPKAQEWVASAKNDYPAQIEAIFADSFYRVGWLTDPNTRPSTAMASASPSPAVGTETAATTASASPALMAAASPAASPFATPAPPLPSSTPAVAAVSPAPSPATTTTAAMALVSPSPTAVSASPAASPKVAAASVTPTALPKVVAAASVAPTGTPTTSPKVAAASVAPTTSPKVASVSVAPSPTVALSIASSPTPSAAQTMVVAAASPAKTAVPSVAPSASPINAANTVKTEAASPAAMASSAETTAANPEEGTTAAAPDNENTVKSLIVVCVLLYFLGTWLFVVWRGLTIKKARKAPLRYSGRKTASQTAEAPR